MEMIILKKYENVIRVYNHFFLVNYGLLADRFSHLSFSVVTI